MSCYTSWCTVPDMTAPTLQILKGSDFAKSEPFEKTLFFVTYNGAALARCTSKEAAEAVYTLLTTARP